MKLQQRLPRWKALQSPLTHAGTLTEAAVTEQQSQAIATQRSLLTDPYPVTSLASGTCELLRQKLSAAKDAASKLQVEHRTALEAAEAWQKITSARRKELESRYSLKAHHADCRIWLPFIVRPHT